jgi:hypothetical protein
MDLYSFEYSGSTLVVSIDDMLANIFSFTVRQVQPERKQPLCTGNAQEIYQYLVCATDEIHAKGFDRCRRKIGQISEPMNQQISDANNDLVYCLMYPKLRLVARSHGYALAVHGSMIRDLDLIAVPWVPQAADAEVLVEALRSAVNGVLPNPDAVYTEPQGSLRPHGRRVFSIHAYDSFSGPYIDLSVMPKEQEDE